MAYSTVHDLLTGDLRFTVDRHRVVDDAADEIDSRLGQIYLTPIVLDEAIAGERPHFLKIKRINNMLATGRLLLAVAAGKELTAQHAYGRRMVAEALSEINEIVSGRWVLPIPRLDVGQPGVGIFNLDKTSRVEDLYDSLENPHLRYVGNGYMRHAGG